MPPAKTNERTRHDWRELGFYYESDNDAHGSPEHGPQIGADVLLRWQLKLGNLVHRKLLTSPASEVVMGSRLEELPFPFHPPRVSELHNSRDTNFLRPSSQYALPLARRERPNEGDEE